MKTCPLLALCALIRPVVPLDNGVGRTPAMGWSSWNVFAGEITESKIMETIDAMAKLTSYGYEYVNVDDNWMEPNRNANGDLVPRADKFPHGIKYLADYAHSKGLKFGIYSAHGSRTCMGNAGSYGHYDQDAELFASWGVDYLKLDSCGGYPSNYTNVAEQYREYAAMRDALNKTGRPIYYSICEISTVPANHTIAVNSPSNMRHKNASYNVIDWWDQKELYDPRGLANSYLIEWTNNNNYFNNNNASGWLNNLDSQQDLTFDELSGPGHWNDNDMLSTGCNNASTPVPGHFPCSGYQTLTEQRSQFALWAMQASPLIMGHDVRFMSNDIIDIITNTEVIALNQDPLGYRARIAWQSDTKTRTLTIFVKKLANPEAPRAVSLFNRGDSPTSMQLTREQLDFADDTCKCMSFRDVHIHQDIKTGEKGTGVVFEAKVASHEALTLLVKCC